MATENLANEDVAEVKIVGIDIPETEPETINISGRDVGIGVGIGSIAVGGSIALWKLWKNRIKPAIDRRKSAKLDDEIANAKDELLEAEKHYVELLKKKDELVSEEDEPDDNTEEEIIEEEVVEEKPKKKSSKK